MSYFSHEDQTNTSEENRCVVEDIERSTEVDDGVTIERRSIFWLSAAAVSSMLFGSSTLSAQDPRPQKTRDRKSQPKGGLSFDSFLQQLYPQAKRLVDSKGEDEEAYLLTVAAAMSRIIDPGAPMRDAMRKFSKANKKAGERFPIGAMTMTFQPGKGFTHHDHLDYNGVIMGIEGEVRIRNYDFQGKPPAIDSSETFQIRETRNDLILPGRFSTLGQKRENIHDLVAGKKGARVMDVFTFFSGQATSRYLDLEDKPRDLDARIYDATWKSRRRRNR